jgi:nicotinamide-nucleotide amidase
MKKSISTRSRELGHALLSKGMRCAVAESCTGGGLAAAITDIPGSSKWFDSGFITYSNESKTRMLGVPTSLLLSCGAVSEAVVREMAERALRLSHAHVSVAISGIAGPDGGSADKPVGTVWIAWASLTHPTRAHCNLFQGNRLNIRKQAVLAALEGLIILC